MDENLIFRGVALCDWNMRYIYIAIAWHYVNLSLKLCNDGGLTWGCRILGINIDDINTDAI
uniref:Uncharacterized protein n=1 Tax=Rhizophora mucronata TaxID=61149 RepID=A0A2P2J5C4_RHIMU